MPSEMPIQFACAILLVHLQVRVTVFDPVGSRFSPESFVYQALQANIVSIANRAGCRCWRVERSQYQRVQGQIELSFSYSRDNSDAASASSAAHLFLCRQENKLLGGRLVMFLSLRALVMASLESRRAQTLVAMAEC